MTGRRGAEHRLPIMRAISLACCHCRCCNGCCADNVLAPACERLLAAQLLWRCEVVLCGAE